MSSYRCMLRPTWMISSFRHKSKFNFELKIKNKSKFNFDFFLNQIFMFPCCSTREDLSIDVSITNVGLILTKLRLFQLFSTSQNSNFELFWKKNQIFEFPGCSTCEDLSIDVSFTNVGLILKKLWWFLFSGYGQTDRQTDRRTDRQTDGQTDSHWKPFHMKDWT